VRYKADGGNNLKVRRAMNTQKTEKRRTIRALRLKQEKEDSAIVVLTDPVRRLCPTCGVDLDIDCCWCGVVNNDVGIA